MNTGIKELRNLLLIVSLFGAIILFNLFFSKLLFSQSKKLINNTVIIDTEISNFMNELISIITDRDDIRLYVVSNNDFNAMATSKNTISIYSGVFDKVNDVEVLLAIIAHELGHISQNHLIRIQKKIDEIKLQNILSGLISVGTVIAMSAKSPNSNYTMIPALTPYLIEDISTKEILSYTQIEESLADQFMIATFLKKKISLNEYINFVSEIAKEEDAIYSIVSNYLSDHPKTSDRLFEIKQYLKNEKIKLSELKRLPKNIFVKYKMIQAKIIGLTNDINVINAKYTEKQELDTPYYFYSIAISNWFNKNYKEALKNFDIVSEYLKKDEYKDIINLGYIFEGKAETYFMYGNIRDSVKNYEYALKELILLPKRNEKNLNIIRESFANVLISSDDKENINRGIDILKKIILKDKKSSAYYYLGIAYGKIKDLGKAHYYLAKYFESIGDIRQMKIHIDKSEAQLDKLSFEYQDLIMLKSDN